MTVSKTNIQGLYLLEPKVFYDGRGWFMETYSKIKLPQLGDAVFVQDNHSFSSNRDTIRGIHFQTGKFSQGKIVRCIRGALLDVAVDLRKNSSTFLKYEAFELSDDNKKMLYIPRGFGHGFVTLTDNVEIVYKTDNYYNNEKENGIIWNDELIGINWNVKNPIISEKDKKLNSVKELLEKDLLF